jgi:hypothetical protein
MAVRSLVLAGRIAAVLAAVAITAGAAVAWLTWPRPVAAPQPRHYLNATACLLTDPRGVVPGTPAAPVWAVMQSASLTAHVMVSYLPETGSGDVTAMLNTLVQRQCGVIVATAASAAQVTAAAKANPGRRFLLVTAPTAAAGPPGNAGLPANAVAIPAADVSGPIARAIRALAASV